MKFTLHLGLLLLVPLAALHAAPIENSKRGDQRALNEAVTISMEENERDHGKQAARRIEALEYLSHLKSPVPSEVAIALAISQSDSNKDVSKAAQKTAETLHLNLDVPALLLEGLSSDNAAARVGAVNGILTLKLSPEQIKAKMVDALMKDDPFARNDVKMLISMTDMPVEEALLQEIQARYAKATDDQVKVALLRALSFDCAMNRERPLANPTFATGGDFQRFSGLRRPPRRINTRSGFQKGV